MQIRTRSTREGGIRRCGVRHVQEWTTWEKDEFDAKEIKRLQEDPDVVVEEVKEKPAKEEKKDEKKDDSKKS